MLIYKRIDGNLRLHRKFNYIVRQVDVCGDKGEHKQEKFDCPENKRYMSS